ncbi:hypothetical protein FQN57_006564 [Myotisia sp. PD_48]|nr:hypothetical protein FQN57_006564 [Myotisia sp. PD_48]
MGIDEEPPASFRKAGQPAITAPVPLKESSAQGARLANAFKRAKKSGPDTIVIQNEDDIQACVWSSDLDCVLLPHWSKSPAYSCLSSPDQLSDYVLMTDRNSGAATRAVGEAKSPWKHAFEEYRAEIFKSDESKLRRLFDEDGVDLLGPYIHPGSACIFIKILNAFGEVERPDIVALDAVAAQPLTEESKTEMTTRTRSTEISFQPEKNRFGNAEGLQMMERDRWDRVLS